jgi:hypothetical protein
MAATGILPFRGTCTSVYIARTAWIGNSRTASAPAGEESAVGSLQAGCARMPELATFEMPIRKDNL